MDYMDVFITVDKQKMRCNNNVRSFVAGTQDFIRFNFILPDEWEDLTIYAQFTQKDGNPYNVYLDSNDCACLPPEIIEGICYLTLKGTRNNTIAITEPLQLTITKNLINNDASVTGITLTLYEQLVNKVDSLLEDDSLIVSTTERVLSEYLEEDKFAAMIIGDNSIELNKLSEDAIATNEEIISYLGLA
jgi:hypothetical protein